MSIFKPNINNARRFTRTFINPYPPQRAEDSDEPILYSYLGTPIYDTLILKPDGTELASGALGEVVQLDQETGLDRNALILNDVLITITQSKNIVKTPIQGRNGTVKEYISQGDYLIDVQGYIVSKEPNVYPFEQIGLFYDYARLEVQIPVVSKLLGSFDITSMVIEDYRFAQQAGFRNRVPFTMQCSSDQDIEVQLSDDVNSSQ